MVANPHNVTFSMTSNQPNRLNRIEESLAETAQLTRSNARAIQALGDRIAEVTHDIAELREVDHQAQVERAELRRATIGIANLLGALDDDRPTILKKLNSIEGKVDQLLEQDNGGEAA